MNNFEHANFLLDILDKHMYMACDLVKELVFLEHYYIENGNELLANQISDRANTILSEAMCRVQTIE